MSRVGAEYTTRELSVATWPDFEQLFRTHPCWCMTYHRPHAPTGRDKLHSRIKSSARNRRQKKRLVGTGLSHGILVYVGREPVGWCSYGLSTELPRIDSYRSYNKLALEHHDRLWRISCFVVHHKHRRRGVARAALRAALDSIRKEGGGLVEAYPMIRWGASTDWFGTASMFRREGFKAVASLGRTNVVMRKEISS
jgi:ribosomal protein S18 acetylase RimI-like enzyme